MTVYALDEYESDFKSLNDKCRGQYLYRKLTKFWSLLQVGHWILIL